MLDVAGGIILAVLFFVCLPFILILGVYAVVVALGIGALILAGWLIDYVNLWPPIFGALIIAAFIWWCVKSYRFVRAKIKGEIIYLGQKEDGTPDPMGYSTFVFGWGGIALLGSVLYQALTTTY